MYTRTYDIQLHFRLQTIRNTWFGIHGDWYSVERRDCVLRMVKFPASKHVYLAQCMYNLHGTLYNVHAYL